MAIIRQIVLDLGGVIFDIDYQHTIDAFKKLDFRNFEQFYSKAKQADLFDKFEKGRVSSSVFCEEVRSYMNQEISDTAIRDAWNAMLIGIPERNNISLAALKDHFPLYLLSNTNLIHLEAVETMIEKNSSFENFSSQFIKLYLSCITGNRKPESSAFQQILDEQNILAEETLFVDDSIQHIEGAKKIGLQTLHIATNEGLNVVLNKLALSI